MPGAIGTDKRIDMARDIVRRDRGHGRPAQRHRAGGRRQRQQFAPTDHDPDVHTVAEYAAAWT